MGVYSVAGRTAATAATADHCVAQLWNPDAAQRVRVIEFGIYMQIGNASGCRWHVSRTSAQGTAGSTVTPDADNAWDVNDGPPSGAVLNLAAFSVQPTLAGPSIAATANRGNIANVGQGFVWVWPWTDFELKPGSGLGIFTGSAVITTVSEVYVVCEEN